MAEIDHLSEEEKSRIIADAKQRCLEIADEINGIKSKIDHELDSDKPDAAYIEELGRKLDLLQELAKIERPEIKLAAMEILMIGDPIQHMIDTCKNSGNDIIKPYPIPTQNSEEPIFSLIRLKKSFFCLTKQRIDGS
jgi:hypothetical protein